MGNIVANASQRLTPPGPRAILDNSDEAGCNSLTSQIIARSEEARKNSVS
jgi:hypothetical protein